MTDRHDKGRTDEAAGEPHDVDEVDDPDEGETWATEADWVGLPDDDDLDAPTSEAAADGERFRRF